MQGYSFTHTDSMQCTAALSCAVHHDDGVHKQVALCTFDLATVVHKVRTLQVLTTRPRLSCGNLSFGCAHACVHTCVHVVVSGACPMSISSCVPTSKLPTRTPSQPSLPHGRCPQQRSQQHCCAQHRRYVSAGRSLCPGTPCCCCFDVHGCWRNAALQGHQLTSA